MLTVTAASTPCYSVDLLNYPFFHDRSNHHASDKMFQLPVSPGRSIHRPVRKTSMWALDSDLRLQLRSKLTPTEHQWWDGTRLLGVRVDNATCPDAEREYPQLNEYAANARFRRLPDVNSHRIPFIRLQFSCLPVYARTCYHIVFPSSCLRLRTSYSLGSLSRTRQSTLFTPSCLPPNIINDAERDIY
jgi:hypothetical protein